MQVGYRDDACRLRRSDEERVLAGGFLETGEVDGYAGSYRGKADHENHERLKAIAAASDPVHGIPVLNL